ncbi:hypothetical protein M0812_05646 [Anaeramoeba flamelloides]|uniref:Vacuolar protein sorting-associated protein 51 homolog n=1 Tax=Anaeramoeba flamelloides TaxID=1746091 RepID=A0AAV8A787_9EUKA|nr:hypothetical protein M0812_05646 [Anaeramoeba flamelloides]
MTDPQSEPTTELRKKNLKKLLSQYYGENSDPQLPLKENTFDLNSSLFQSDEYVKKLLQEKTYEELIGTNNKLVEELSTYDQKLQILVYQNYSKFIDASDKINYLGNHVETMEKEIDKLTTKLKKIENLNEKITTRLTPKHKNIRRLEGINEVSKKIQYLLELPEKLSVCVKLKEYGQAVNFYLHALKPLEKYSNLSNFQKIKSQSDLIIQDIKKTLLQTIHKNEKNNEKINESVKLLIKLGEDEKKIIGGFINSKITKTSKKLQRFEKIEIDPILKILDQSQSQRPNQNQNETKTKNKNENKTKDETKNETKNKNQNPESENKTTNVKTIKKDELQKKKNSHDNNNQENEIKISLGDNNPENMYIIKKNSKNDQEEENENENENENRKEREKGHVLKKEDSYSNIDKIILKMISNLTHLFLEDFLELQNIIKILFLKGRKTQSQNENKREKENKNKNERENDSFSNLLLEKNLILCEQFIGILKKLLFHKKLSIISLKNILELIPKRMGKYPYIFKDKLNVDRIFGTVFNDSLQFHINLRFESFVAKFKAFLNETNSSFAISLRKFEKSQKLKRKAMNNNKLKGQQQTQTKENSEITRGSILTGTFEDIKNFLKIGINNLVNELSYFYEIYNFNQLEKEQKLFILNKIIKQKLTIKFVQKYQSILNQRIVSDIRKMFFNIYKKIESFMVVKKKRKMKKKRNLVKVEPQSQSRELTKTHEAREEKSTIERANNDFYYLILSKLLRSLFQNGIYNLIGKFAWLLGESGIEIANYITSTPSRTHKKKKYIGEQLSQAMANLDLSKILKESRLLSKKILNYFVEVHGRNISQMIRKSIETPDWRKTRKPRGVRTAIQYVFNEFKVAYEIVSPNFRHYSSSSKNKNSNKNNHNNNDDDDDDDQDDDDVMINNNSENGSVNRSWSSLSRGSTLSYSLREPLKGSEQKGDKYRLIESNIEKLFAEKIIIFENVNHDRDSIMTGIGKIVLKTFLESIRLRTFSTEGFNQIQIDSFFLRMALSKYIDRTILNILSDEIIISTSSRCTDPIRLEQSIIETLSKEILEKVML